MPLVIGLTGSIAAGKSTVAHTLVGAGALHCDVDAVVHNVYAPGQPAFGRVVERFGADVVGADGAIDRKKLGALVFGNAERMHELNQAIGDIAAIVSDTLRSMRQAAGNDGVLVIEAVHLVGGSHPGRRHQTWLVVCDDETAKRRLQDDRGLTEAEVLQRMASQRPWTEIAWAADAIFHNDGTRENLIGRVQAEYERIRGLYRAGSLPPPKYESPPVH